MIAMQSRVVSRLVFFLLLAVFMCQAGCGGSASQPDVASPVAAAEPAVAGPASSASSFAVVPAGDTSAQHLGLEILEQQGQVVVRVHSTVVQQLDGVFFTLSYDPARYTPLVAQATDAVATPSESICLEMLSVPGTVSFGHVSLNGAGSRVDAGIVLAEVLFACGPFPMETTRSVLQVPAHKSALSPLVWDGEAGELRWYYVNPGDCNQDGLVALSDLSPLGHEFGASGPFSYFTAHSVVDGNGDGVVNIADLTAIGQYWGSRVEGYNLYASNDVGDIPTGFSEPSTIKPLANFSLGDALGDPAADRLWFSYALDDTGQYTYYWVRPYACGSEGTRSNVNGPSLDMPPPIDPGGDGFNLAPVARLGLAYAGNHMPLAVTFDATQSSDPDGVIVFYEWDFEGDGLFDSFSTGAVALHTYMQAGIYAPLVRVTDNGGLWDSFQSPPFTLSEEEVSNIPPVADLMATAYSGEEFLTVGLIATGSTDVDGYITQYEWDFVGDGIWNFNSGTDPTVLQIYEDPGTFYTTVRVTDNHGATDTSAVTIEVAAANRPPTANLAVGAGESSGYAPHTVHFDASGSSDPDNNITKYWWDFDGDGCYEFITFDPTCIYTYVNPGTFKASVMVEDTQGAKAAAYYQTIYVDPPWNQRPRAVLHAQIVYSPTPFTVRFDASGSYDPDGSIVKYEWDFNGDGTYESYGSQDNVEHTYPFFGEFTAYVRVTDDDGARATAIFKFPAEPNDWPMFGHDRQHTRRSPFIGAQTNNLKWAYDAGDWMYSSPAIGVDGTVYVGSEDNLYAINPDGSLEWTYTTGGNVTSSPAIGVDGTVYVGSRDHKLYAINPDGTFKWSYTTGNDVHSSPAIGADGTVYVGSWDDKLYAINPDGSMKWSYPTGSYVYSSPAIDADGTVYVGSDDRKLHAVNPDGTLKWSYSTGSYVHFSSPAIGADGTVYVGSRDDKLYAINPDGTLKWSYNTGGHVSSSPAIGADGTVYVGSSWPAYSLYAISPNGALKWSYTTGGRVESSPAIGADGTVYVGSWDRKLYAINPHGTLKWSYSTGSYVRSSPAIGADGTVYVGSDDGKLYAFGL